MTQSALDLQLAELLASRLCHDLVGPISAISNGMELLEEGLAELDEEAKRLVGDSAGQAAASLQFFRVAFGFGAAPADDPAQLRQLLQPFLGHRKTTLEWRADLPPVASEAGLPDGWGKLLLNMAALAAEALPTGGRVEVAVSGRPAGGALSCLAAGADAGLRDEVLQAMAPGAGVEGLTPRSVQGFYARRVAERLGASLTSELRADGRFALSAVVGA